MSNGGNSFISNEWREIVTNLSDSRCMGFHQWNGRTKHDRNNWHISPGSTLEISGHESSNQKRLNESWGIRDQTGASQPESWKGQTTRPISDDHCGWCDTWEIADIPSVESP